MTIQLDPAALGIQKFGIGQPVRRSEDPVLLRGEGRYSDDVNLPGQFYGVMVRSPIAHGVIKGIETADALKIPGVVAIYTAKDLAERGYGPIRCILPFTNADGSPMLRTQRLALTDDKVRYVGDPVAMVVAKSHGAAVDAAEAVRLDLEALPTVTDVREAVKAGAPQLYDDVPGNVALDFGFGDMKAVNAVFDKAAHVTRLNLINNRIVVAAMEPRAAVAGPLYHSRQFARRVRHAQQFESGAGCHTRQGACADRPCRRLVRHEDLGFPRICLPAACGARAGQAGQKRRSPLGQLPVGFPRARQRGRGGTGTGQQGPFSGDPHRGLWQSGRLYVAVRADDADAQCRQKHAKRL